MSSNLNLRGSTPQNKVSIGGKLVNLKEVKRGKNPGYPLSKEMSDAKKQVRGGTRGKGGKKTKRGNVNVHAKGKADRKKASRPAGAGLKLSKGPTYGVNTPAKGEVKGNNKRRVRGTKGGNKEMGSKFPSKSPRKLGLSNVSYRKMAAKINAKGVPDSQGLGLMRNFRK